MAWDDEKKAKVIEMYEEAQPTPETSMEIVQDIAKDVDESPNGVRMILSKAGVYVKKEASKGGKSGEDKPASTRVSKADAQDSLRAAIEKVGGTVDDDIISRLTGKAAVYFTSVLTGKEDSE